MQHGLNLRGSEQRRRPFGQHNDFDGRRKCRQLAVGRLVDDELAGAGDLDAQIAALGDSGRDQEQGLALRV